MKTAVECGLRGESGVIGHDEDHGGRLRAIEFPRIAGGKPFDVELPWFNELLKDIRQPRGKLLPVTRHEFPTLPPASS